MELQREEYDVILALSITKWVHLNFGDIGIKRLFRRVYRQLRPGGVFIVEPQPLSSYKKRKNLNVSLNVFISKYTNPQISVRLRQNIKHNL